MLKSSLTALALAIPVLCSAQSYTVTDLGTLGGTIAIATAINTSGEITGGSTNAAGTYHAFLYSGGHMTDLGSLGGPSSQGQGINASGTVAGYAQLPPSRIGGYPPHPISPYTAFTDANGKMTTIGPVGGTGYGINDAGQVIGVGTGGGFIWTNGNAVNLGNLGGTSGPTQPEAINVSGEVVGYSYLPSGDFRGFVWTNGKMTALSTLGGDWSQAYGVNASGQVTGTAYTSGNLTNPAFLFTNGTMKNIGTLSGGTTAVGRSINTSGVIVGYGNVPDPNFLVYHAFIYTGGKMQDLNNLIAKGSGWVLAEANSINDAGQIVGYGTVNGLEHAFLLTKR